MDVDVYGSFASRYKVLEVEVVQMFGIPHERASYAMREVFNFEKDIADVS